MIVVQRTVSRSAQARRPDVRPRHNHEDAMPAPRGVDLAGLGCSLAEWDAIAATMPPELRPARGNWNGSFERAAIAYYRRRVATAPADSAAAPVPPPEPSRAQERAELLEEVLHVLEEAGAPLTARQISVRLALSLNRTYNRLRELEALGAIVSARARGDLGRAFMVSPLLRARGVA